MRPLYFRFTDFWRHVLDELKTGFDMRPQSLLRSFRGTAWRSAHSTLQLLCSEMQLILLSKGPWLCCEKVNLHSTLIMWAWDACDSLCGRRDWAGSIAWLRSEWLRRRLGLWENQKKLIAYTWQLEILVTTMIMTASWKHLWWKYKGQPGVWSPWLLELACGQASHIFWCAARLIETLSAGYVWSENQVTLTL